MAERKRQYRNPAMRPAVIKALLAALAAGHSMEEAAARAELHPGSVRRWITRGNVEWTRLESLGLKPEDIEDDDPRIRDSERAYCALSRAAERVQAQAVADLLATLYQAGTSGIETEDVTLDIRIDRESGEEIVTGRKVVRRNVKDLGAAKWLLERLAPERYHLPSNVQLSGPNGEPLHIAGMSANQAELLAVLLRTYTDALLQLAPPRSRERMRERIPDALQAAFEAIEALERT